MIVTAAHVVVEACCLVIVAILALLILGRLVTGDWEWFVQDDPNEAPHVPAGVDLEQLVATTRAIDEDGAR